MGKNIDNAVAGGVSMSDFMNGAGGSMVQLSTNLAAAMDKLNQKFPLLSDGVQKIIDKINGVTPIKGKDVLKMPGQEIELLPEDSFAAFTKGSEVLKNMGGNNNTSSTTPSTTNSTIDLNHTLTLNINAPSNINTEQLVSMFNDTGVSQALGIAVKEAFNNGGLTTSNPNKQQMLKSGSLQHS
jgi:hypothetical protein